MAPVANYVNQHQWKDNNSSVMISWKMHSSLSGSPPRPSETHSTTTGGWWRRTRSWCPSLAARWTCATTSHEPFWVFLHFCSISWFQDSIEIAAELQIECVACITQKWPITDYWIKTEHQMTRLNVSMQKTSQEVVVAQVVEQLPSVCAGLSAFFRSELLSIYSHWVLGILL